MADRPGWNEPNLSPTQVKRQHIVPRIFLRPFAGNDGKLRVVDLASDKEYRTSIQNAAVETHFYDLEMAGLTVSTEDWLGQLEGDAAPVIQRLIAHPECIGSLTLAEELSLGRFLAALRFRTPAFRDWESTITSSFLSQFKEMAREQLYHLNEHKEADLIWESWKDKPDHWWMNQEVAEQPAAGSAHMMGEVQGYANLLRAAPWRSGRSSGSLRLYTSDNPVSGYLSPVRSWWEGGAFSSFTYYISLAPDVLLKIGRRLDKGDQGGALEPQGERRCSDFSDYEVSIARHIITDNANRFLYGEGLVVPKDCARECLERVGQVNLQLAIRYQGFDPRPPTVQVT